ncbi:MAG: hypothetical protein A4E71_00538 [Smithella sp. PtaU1.Bin162]|nr:MAG: hypothetical protein A4E71_00538 [Smithella sp. PtaU1.Bin162]
MKQLLELKEPLGIIDSSSALFSKIKRMRINYSQENAIFFYLDTKNKLIKSEVLFKGGLNSCNIDPRTLFRRALKLNSNSIIFAHNHPSGDLTPSDEDCRITGRISKAGEIIGICLLDSVTFNKKEYYSFWKEVED